MVPEHLVHRVHLVVVHQLIPDQAVQGQAEELIQDQVDQVHQDLLIRDQADQDQQMELTQDQVDQVQRDLLILDQADQEQQTQLILDQADQGPLIQAHQDQAQLEQLTPGHLDQDQLIPDQRDPLDHTVLEMDVQILMSALAVVLLVDTPLVPVVTQPPSVVTLKEATPAASTLLSETLISELRLQGKRPSASIWTLPPVRSSISIPMRRPP